MNFDLRVKNGRVIDPSRDPGSQTRDLWINDGRIVAPPLAGDAVAARTIDAQGDIVMAGGVDVHCHIAGSKVNAARALRPEAARDATMRRRGALRSGTGGITPSTFATGYLYAGLGYTTALDAAIPPLGARHAHHEFADTPLIDKAFLVLLGNNHFLMDRIREKDSQAVRDALAWIVGAVKGFGVKVVNPGGVERWKSGARNVFTLDDQVEPFGVTPRDILKGLAQAIDELDLPHPMHLHGLNLGLPENAAITLETLRALDGHRVHCAHAQFHSYGPEEAKTGCFASAVAGLADFVNAHPTVSVDVGQVMFGETTSMTADGAVGHYLARLTGRKWVNMDVEMESGCGVVPITYHDNQFVHALQWAIGLEWFLRVENPWQVAMSTDHPNGASFLSYPKIIAQLMDRELRASVLKTLPESARSRTSLGDLDREYTLEEIAVITRAAPARMMGLNRKGRLTPGADADVAIYRPDDDKERMFAHPRYVIKAGEIVVDDGELVASPFGKTHFVAPPHDPGVADRVASWIKRDYTIQPGNYVVGLEEVANPADALAKEGES